MWSCKNELDYKNAACASWLQAIIIIPTSETANFWGNITRDVTASVTESCHPHIYLLIIINNNNSSQLWSFKFRRVRKVEFVLVRIRSGWHQHGAVCEYDHLYHDPTEKRSRIYHVSNVMKFHLLYFIDYFKKVWLTNFALFYYPTME